MHWVYVWIEDGGECLNEVLVSNGVFPGGVMIDMVESAQRLSQILLDPKLTDTRAQVEKERAAIPLEDLPKRLIMDLPRFHGQFKDS